MCCAWSLSWQLIYGLFVPEDSSAQDGSTTVFNDIPPEDRELLFKLSKLLSRVVEIDSRDLHEKSERPAKAIRALFYLPLRHSNNIRESGLSKQLYVIARLWRRQSLILGAFSPSQAVNEKHTTDVTQPRGRPQQEDRTVSRKSVAKTTGETEKVLNEFEKYEIY